MAIETSAELRRAQTRPRGDPARIGQAEEAGAAGLLALLAWREACIEGWAGLSS